LGPLCIPAFGKAVWDLGLGPFWPQGYAPAWPRCSLLEAQPSRAALKLKVEPLEAGAMGLGAYEALPLDHDFAYHSGKLMAKAVEFLKQA
jgi:hypothetical protein